MKGYLNLGTILAASLTAALAIFTQGSEPEVRRAAQRPAFASLNIPYQSLIQSAEKPLAQQSEREMDEASASVIGASTQNFPDPNALSHYKAFRTYENGIISPSTITELLQHDGIEHKVCIEPSVDSKTNSISISTENLTTGRDRIKLQYSGTSFAFESRIPDVYTPANVIASYTISDGIATLSEILVQIKAGDQFLRYRWSGNSLDLVEHPADAEEARFGIRVPHEWKNAPLTKSLEAVLNLGRKLDLVVTATIDMGVYLGQFANGTVSAGVLGAYAARIQ